MSPHETKILIACDTNVSRPWHRDRIPAIHSACRAIGCDYEIIDIYDILGQHEYMPTNVEVRRKFLQSVDIDLVNENFEEEIARRKPNILMLGTADNYKHFLLPRTVCNLRDRGIYVVGILGDDEFKYPEYRFLVGWFDHFVAYVKPCYEYYQNLRVSDGYYLPNSCYLNGLEFEDHSQETECDVTLIGAPIANRPEMMRELIDSGLKVEIYGSKEWHKYDFAAECYRGFVDSKMFDEVLRRGKIVLAFMEDHLTGSLHMNTKIWEAVRVGRLPISTFYQPLISDYKLAEDREIVMYNDTSDLVKKAKFFAANRDARLKISRALYNKVKQDLDYALLYRKLFEKLLDECKTNSPGVNSGTDRTREIKSMFEHEGTTYFSKPYSSLDLQAITPLLKILESVRSNDSEIDYIYFNRLENGKRVIPIWPFISWDSIIFFSKGRNRFSLFITFILSYFTGKALHIKQFCVFSDRATLFGRICVLVDLFAVKEIRGLFHRLKMFAPSHR
jgi:hypothetical protein